MNTQANRRHLEDLFTLARKAARKAILPLAGLAMLGLAGAGGVAMGAALLACDSTGTASAKTAGASAQVKGFTDAGITGTVTFASIPGETGVLVQGTIRGLQYGSVYAIHVHEKGNCAAPDSAGGHFHTGAETHGNPFDEAAMHHDGDLPNLQVDSAGVGHFDLRTASLQLGTGPLNPVGRSIIVHAGPDDYKSQPSGNSGSRIACGVIVAE